MKKYIFKYTILFLSFPLLFLWTQSVFGQNDPPPGIDFTTNTVCRGDSDGFIDMDFNGGCPPYTIYLDDGNGYQDQLTTNTTDGIFNDLKSGKYEIIIKDNSECKLSGIANIGGSWVDVGFTGITPAIIDGEKGSITIRITAKDEPYNIVWTDETGEVIANQTLTEAGETSISGLDPGEYCAEVTNENGCVKKICTPIDSSPGNCICSNNELSDALEEMYATGNGFTVLGASGIGITDASISLNETFLPCTGPFTYLWEEVGVFVEVISIFPLDIEISLTQTLDVPASSSYVNGITSGIYILTVTDICGEQGQLTVFVPNGICLVDGNGIPVGMQGAGIVESAYCEENSGHISPYIHGYNEPITYQWSNGATTKNLYDLGTGHYCLTVTSADDCTDSGCFDISSEVGLIIKVVEVKPHCSGDIDTDGNGSLETKVNELGSITVEVEKNSGVFPNGDITIKWEDGTTGDTREGLQSGNYCVTAEIGDGSICSVTKCFTVPTSTPKPGAMLTANCKRIFYCGEDDFATFSAETDYDFPNGNCIANVICIAADPPFTFDTEEGTPGQIFEPDSPTDCEGLQVPCTMGNGKTYNIDIPNSDGNIEGMFYMINIPGPDDDDNPWGALDGKCYAVKFCRLSNGYEIDDPVMEIIWSHPNPVVDGYTTQGRDDVTGQCYEYYFCDPNKPAVRKKPINDNLCAKKVRDLPIEISSIAYTNTLLNYIGSNSIFNNAYSVNQFDPSLEPIWEQSLSGAGNIWGTDIVNLYNGSVLSVGYFTEDIRTADHWLYASEGAEDIFFVKHDVEGNRQWLKTIGGIGADKCQSIAVDKLQGVWLTGSFTDEMDIENIRLTGTGQDTYFAKYNGLGYLLWAKALEGTGRNTGLAIETDNEHNAYLLGSFQDDIQFGSKTSQNNDDYSDMFLAKYDKDGNFIWRKHARSIATHFEKADMAVDNEGNILIYGAFRNGFSFTPYSEDAIYTTSFKEDLFLVKYNSNGDLLWTRQLGNTEDAMHLGGIETDRYGNILVNGGFEGRAIFEGVGLEADGESSIFVAQYSSDGQLDWVKKEGGANKDAATCIAVNDVRGNTYYAGFHYGDAQIEGEQFTSGEFVHNGFVVELGGQSNPAKNEETIEVVETVSESAMLVEKIYPNPFNKEMQVDIQSPRKEQITFDVYSMMGEKALSEKHQLTEGKNTISLTLKEKMPNGVYLLKIIDGKKQVTTHKIVKTSK